MNKAEIEKEGISLREANRVMMIATVLISVVLLFSTFFSSLMFEQVSKASEEYILWQEDAYQLMDASDYLTEEVQCYTVTLERVHLDNYFTEANENRRREGALDSIPEDERDSKAYSDLLAAMDDSLHLMEKEYYAMALIVNAQGADPKTYPQEIQAVRLSAEDLALSKDEKIRKAQTMVHDADYYAEKNMIRKEMNACVQELKESTNRTRELSSQSMAAQLNIGRILIIVHTISIMTIFYLTNKLGILPILKGVEKIDEDSPIPVIGAREFRYLARSYNKMYDTYKESIAHLNYDVSHDALTGLYNREGYELLKESIDIKNTTTIFIDIDDFKEINDTYGHETGDKILQKVAASLNKHFRSEDYLCRIGGDEFVIFMIHSKSDIEKLISRKVNKINQELSKTDDGLPAVSISAGAASGRKEKDQEEMIRHADEALYDAKDAGKKGWSFYRK